jgi:HSP20 family protein
MHAIAFRGTHQVNPIEVLRGCGIDVPADAASAATWTPSVDVAETEAAIILKADVPGFKVEDLDIRYEEGRLTISGERKAEEAVDGHRYHRLERLHGRFERTFRLPRSIDSEKVTAVCRDGVLEVELPKREETKPRSIRIDVKS